VKNIKQAVSCQKSERIEIMIDKKAYIKGKGLICPFCKAESVQGGFIHVEAGKTLQEMNCLECDSKWQDVYQLIDVIPNEEGQ
jgi:hypothetical protein